ncbi:hypothetical protein ACFE04_005749 [Oxalis oulophora]
MGNTVSPCLGFSSPSSSAVKLIVHGGPTKILTGGKHVAGEIMFESPDKMVCHADSFFIGHHIPILSINDKLLPGQTYFVLPISLFPSQILSASSLNLLSKLNPNGPVNFGNTCPFSYIKGGNGRVLIKVVPEFIAKLINGGNEKQEEENEGNFLCSTPELKKHYDILVGSKEQVWSPKLETITEYKNIRFSPCRFIEWKIVKERED